MNIIDSIVRKLSKWADVLAGLAVFSIMALIIANIILKKIFKSPILGTFEYVGFLTSIAVSMGLAYCAYKDFHIAIGLFVDKLSEKKQAVVKIITNSFILTLLSLFSAHIIRYAARIALSGEVSPTTQTPIHYFIYIAGIGIALLCLVILMQLVKTLLKVVHK